MATGRVPPLDLLDKFSLKLFKADHAIHLFGLVWKDSPMRELVVFSGGTAAAVKFEEHLLLGGVILILLIGAGLFYMLRRLNAKLQALSADVRSLARKQVQAARRSVPKRTPPRGSLPRGGASSGAKKAPRSR